MSYFRAKIIYDWGVRCFGVDHMNDRKVRALRLLEEAVELCQALSVSEQAVMKTTSIVYQRPPGIPKQELGGVMVCASALAYAQGWDVESICNTEVHRCLSKTPEHFAKRNAEKIAMGLTG